jgi:hypothetical protein
MSSKRTLTDKIAWTDDLRTIELLDWETRPEDFDRLCEFIIATFAERDGATREQLFSILPEEEFRAEIRVCAELFTERFQSLVGFIHLRMNQLVLPEAARRKK